MSRRLQQYRVTMQRTILLGSLLVLAACPANLLGWNKSSAEDNARAWATEVGLDTQTIVCNSRDTDGDGYVSCTFHVKEDVRTFECAGWTLVMPHSGCREPKIKVPRLSGRKD